MMASQSRGMPVQHNPSPNNYRLIELPPDLQNILEAEDAPVLSIESSDTSAVIKTPNKTYALRQKNTSNALMLLSPMSSPSSDEPFGQGISIISTIKETVELDTVPEKAAAKSALGKGKWHERFGRNR